MTAKVKKRYVWSMVPNVTNWSNNKRTDTDKKPKATTQIVEDLIPLASCYQND